MEYSKRLDKNYGRKMIIICEPQCIGFEHVPVNSALLKVFQKATNDDILFISEKNHSEMVKENLGSDPSINYEIISVPDKEKSNVGRCSQEFKIVKKTFELADSLKADKIIFASIKSPSLIAIKYYLRKYNSIKALVIPHSLIDSINKAPVSRDFIFWIRLWLNPFNTNRLKYLLLGETINDELLKRMPQLEGHTEFIDHPYFFKDPPLKQIKSEDTVTFGFLGVGYRKKGLETFFKLSEEVKNKKKLKADFLLAGFVAEDDLDIPESVKASKSSLNSDEYVNRLEKIDYALLLHKPEDYRFTASGVFFDAISYLKPIIALENPFFKYYFNMMGDIGYLCKDYHHILETLIKIIESDKIHYQKQQTNILEGRKAINLDSIAIKLKTILDNWD